VQVIARQHNGANEVTIALQTMLTASGCNTGPIDGRFGYRTKRALQTFLQANGYAVGPIDGMMGYRTTRALQTFLRDNGASPGPIDGRAGPRTTMALHLFLANRSSGMTIPNGTPVVDALPIAEAVVASNNKEFAVNDAGEALIILAGVPQHAVGSAAA